MADIPVCWSPQTRRHDPRQEIWVGVATPGTEVAGRVDAILTSLPDRPAIEVSGGRGLAVAAQVHDPALLDHLATAHRAWLAGEYQDLVGQDRVVPYLFPTPAMVGAMPWRRAAAVHARAGEFCYDTMTLLGPGSWEAIVAAADCAVEAVDQLTAHPAVYALCRPPGHHATTSGYGGSCYLNNAAIAAQALVAAGHRRVAVIDIDAHHGNGTQEIFWHREDVLYGSVHVDPAAGWFPHLVGHPEETGAGAGAGCNRNLPLPEGAGDVPWLGAVTALADWVGEQEVSALVVSLGVDAAEGDPESPLQVSTQGYYLAGTVLGSLGVPSVLIQEGGYVLDTIGTLVAAYLSGHQEAG